ncbi:MAG: outer membrane beta-barrel protein [Candidatus Dadabacteria bacterium]
MKTIVLATVAISLSMASFAQKDTTGREKADTIKVGGMIIIKKAGKDTSRTHEVIINTKKKTKVSNPNISTNWWVVDLGFANVTDNTNYSTAQSQGFVGPGVGKDQMKLRTGKSINVNIWMFMQKLNLINHYVNLKYGLGAELNNYRFENNDILFQKNPTRIILNNTSGDGNVEKNKLAADYVTVPVMLNFNFTPHQKRNGFGFSAGVSGGYLYSSREKLKYADDHKNKIHSDFDLRKWKLSYIGELSLGPVRLYGSVASQNMWEKGLDQTPYNIGIRFSHM